MTRRDVPVLTGGKLRALRKARNMTQEEIAAAIGVAKTTVCVWERGRVKIPPDRNAMLRAFFDGASHSTVYRRGKAARERMKNEKKKEPKEEPKEEPSVTTAWMARTLCDACARAYADKCQLFATCKAKGVPGLRYTVRVSRFRKREQRMLEIRECDNFLEETERRKDFGCGDLHYLALKFEKEKF